LRFLGVLEELSNIDKHRFLHVTGAVAAEGSGEIIGAVNVGQIKVRHLVRPIEEGARFQVLEADFPTPAEVQVKADITPDVIFDVRAEARSVRARYVPETLQAIREVIGRFVLASLGPEIARHLGAGVQVTQTPAPR
jgi:hypothetical protein